MSQKRSQRMLLVQQMAEREEETAASQLQLSRQQVTQAEQQLQQIESYQRDYKASLNERRGGISIQTMMNDRLFLQQLNQALNGQQAQLKQLQNNEERALNHWQQCYHRRRNIEQLIGKLRRLEGEAEEKQLQKQMDELTSVMMGRRAV